jgi:hypothetical protein
MRPASAPIATGGALPITADALAAGSPTFGEAILYCCWSIHSPSLNSYFTHSRAVPVQGRRLIVATIPIVEVVRFLVLAYSWRERERAGSLRVRTIASCFCPMRNA